MIQPDALTGFNFFLEGVGQGGKIKTFPLPDLEFLTESHRAGAMMTSVEIDQGLEKLMISGAEFVGATPALWKTFKHRTLDGLQIRVQGNYKAPTETTDKQLVATFRGKWTRQAHDKFESQKNGGITVDAALVYYKLEYAGQVIYEIDVLNTICIIDGVDIWAQYRANLGI